MVRLASEIRNVTLHLYDIRFQAFLHLLLGYLGESVTDHADFMKTRDKTGLPWPFGVGPTLTERYGQLTR